MSDIHSLNNLPSQAAINSVATYREEFEKTSFNYREVLCNLKFLIISQKFICTNDNTRWMHRVGNDYLNNPKLFSHAPLTYLCILLSEIFKADDLYELQKKLSPQTLQCALTRLEEFTV